MNSDTSDPEYDFTGVYIATPCYGMQLYYQCANSIMREVQLLNQNGYRNCVEFLGNESHIDRARMFLSAAFMGGTDFSHLMFIDSDIEFPEGAVMRLLAHTVHNQVGMVGGLYPKKGYPIEYAVNAPEKMAALETFDGGEIYETNDLGTGFLLIHRRVFEKLAEHYPDSHIEMAQSQLESFPEGIRESVNNWYRDFFHSECFPSKRTGKRLFKSEDYAFCRRWGDAGGAVYFDPAIQLSHIGAHLFRGDTKTLAQTIEEMRK